MGGGGRGGEGGVLWGEQFHLFMFVTATHVNIDCTAAQLPKTLTKKVKILTF